LTGVSKANTGAERSGEWQGLLMVKRSLPLKIWRAISHLVTDCQDKFGDRLGSGRAPTLEI